VQNLTFKPVGLYSFIVSASKHDSHVGVNVQWKSATNMRALHSKVCTRSVTRPVDLQTIVCMGLLAHDRRGLDRTSRTPGEVQIGVSRQPPDAAVMVDNGRPPFARIHGLPSARFAARRCRPEKQSALVRVARRTGRVGRVCDRGPQRYTAQIRSPKLYFRRLRYSRSDTLCLAADRQ
jgi:hypothetical protein